MVRTTAPIVSDILSNIKSCALDYHIMSVLLCSSLIVPVRGRLLHKVKTL